MRKSETNISESLLFGMLLALSGGLMDAYSYLFRGGVFANAQTGNILLLSVSLSRADWSGALKYTLPVAAFSIGIAVSSLLKTHTSWRRSRAFALGAEFVIFIAVAFIPRGLDNVANALISLACGIQLQAFGVINKSNVATTMCIGNLRSAIDHTVIFFANKEKNSIKKAGVYAAVIAAFALGAVAGGLLIEAVGSYAISGCAVIVLICGCMLWL